MEVLREQDGNRDWNRWNELRLQLNEVYKEEEVYWCQKARLQLLKEGDKNIQYFQVSLVQRKNSNRIEQLEKEEGGWCQNDEEIVKEISEYYTRLFTYEDSYNWEDKLSGIPTTITNSLNSSLIKLVEDDEIRQALFSMNPNKSLGIDGMTPLFFQTLKNYAFRCL